MSTLLSESQKNIFGNKYPPFIKKINLKIQGGAVHRRHKKHRDAET